MNNENCNSYKRTEVFIRSCIHGKISLSGPARLPCKQPLKHDLLLVTMEEPSQFAAYDSSGLIASDFCNKKFCRQCLIVLVLIISYDLLFLCLMISMSDVFGVKSSVLTIRTLSNISIVQIRVLIIIGVRAKKLPQFCYNSIKICPTFLDSNYSRRVAAPNCSPPLRLVHLCWLWTVPYSEWRMLLFQFYPVFHTTLSNWFSINIKPQGIGGIHILTRWRLQLDKWGWGMFIYSCSTLVHFVSNWLFLRLVNIILWI